MRNCETIGIPSMFRSRVSGVGISVPTAEETRKETERAAKMTPALQEYQRKVWNWRLGLAAAQSKCPPLDPNIRYIQAPVCQPAVDYLKSNPKPTPPEGATKWEIGLAEMTPPVDRLAPDTTPSPAPTAKPTGSALPLLLGAAFLLLS